jgi:hypothetical protein
VSLSLSVGNFFWIRRGTADGKSLKKRYLGGVIVAKTGRPVKPSGTRHLGTDRPVEGLYLWVRVTMNAIPPGIGVGMSA